MNVLVELEKCSREAVAGLREEYLDGLAFSQDAFLEAQVGVAQFVLIRYKARVIGYCAVSEEHTLLEYHLSEQAIYLAQSIYPKLIAQLAIQRAVVKSFDYLALSNALDLGRRTTVLGMLVRKYVRQNLVRLPHIAYDVRIAEAADTEAVLAVEQDVFSDPTRIAAVILQQQMLLFQRDKTLIGFGILRPVRPNRADIEVGIAVDRPFRNKGYAAYMLVDLVEHCVSLGGNPVSGCSIGNVASIRLGQRIGLCARHRLLEIEF